MKLNTVNAESTSLHIKFGISQQRADELSDFIEQIHNEVYSKLGTAIKLGEIYQRVAAACNDLAEYTLCMHMLIFNLAKLGKPADHCSFTN